MYSLQRISTAFFPSECAFCSTTTLLELLAKDANKAELKSNPMQRIHFERANSMQEFFQGFKIQYLYS